MRDDDKKDAFLKAIASMAELPNIALEAELSDEQTRALNSLAQIVATSIKGKQSINERSLLDMFNRLESPELAIQSYERLDASDMLSYKDLVNLSILYAECKRYDDAAAVLERAVSDDPHTAEAYIGLTHVYFKLGRIDDAFEAAEKALEINPSRPQALAHYGELIFYDGRQKEGMEYMECAVAIIEERLRTRKLSDASKENYLTLIDDIENEMEDAKEAAEWLKKQPAGTSLG